MKIGVVVTCRNAWAYTEAALPTIRSEHELFVCVVDDGSTDGTKAGLKRWQSEDKAGRWAMYDPPFDSLAGKWNAGVRKCWEQDCDFVLVSNNDVLFHPGTIDTLAARLDVGDVVMATGCDISGIFTEKGIPPEFITTDECVLDDDLAPEAEAPDFSCFMLSKACWDEVGEFDQRYTPAYFEDNDYHERLLRADLKAVNLPSAPYYHHGSVTRDEDPAPDEQKHVSFEQTKALFFDKWGYHPGGNAAVGRLSKIKLLIIGDGDRPTGFARVIHSVAERLVQTGDYEIHHLAINFWGDPPDVPWHMYPAHLSQPSDPYGRGRVQELYTRLEPDAVFMVQDPWHIADYVRTLRGMRGLTAYYPVDSPNLNPVWVTHLARCVELCTYTQFGADQTAHAAKVAFDQVVNDAISQYPEDAEEIRVASVGVEAASPWSDPNFVVPMKRLHDLQDPGAFNVIPHGVDLDVFHPIDKKIARRKWELPLDGFVVGYVHRNQPRKRQDAMFRSFAKFIKGVRDRDFGIAAIEKIREAPVVIADAHLIIHAAMEEMAGWALPDLARDYGITPWVRFTKPPDQSSALPESDLNALFNTFDVNANVGGGEGWGLSHIESAVCGVAQLVPDWSATGEVWKDHAVLVPVKEVRHEPQNLNTMQAVVDTDAAADGLLRLYEDRGECIRLSERAAELASRPEYTWDSVAGRFDEIIKRAAHTKGVPHDVVTIHRKKAA